MFRTVTIALVVSCLGYYAIPVYVFLLLLSICIAWKFNSENDDFVMRGVKSIFIMVELLS